MVCDINSCTLHHRHSRRCAELFVILLTLLFYLHHAGGIVFLTCRDVVAANAIDIAEPACTNLGGNTLAANEVVLGEAVLRDSDDRSGINGVILRLMEGDSLRSTIDIYALQITVALDDSLGIEAVILHQYRIAVGIIGLMVVADLRRGSRMVVVLIPVCEIVRL